MKEIRELDQSTLTTEQKLGILLCANLYFDDDIDNAIEMIREHKLGSVWISHAHPKRAEIVARDGDITTWIDKNVADTLGELDLTLDRNAPALRQLEDFIRTATEMANGNFLVTLPDAHSNMDTLSALLSPMNLCYEVMDSPALLQEKLRQINDAYATLYDIFYEAGRMKENGTVNWIPIWCQERSAAIECDFSCMISPRDGRTPGACARAH